MGDCGTDGCCGLLVTRDTVKKQTYCVGLSNVIAHVFGFFCNLPFFIENGDNFVSSGIGMLVPLFATGFVVMGLISGVLLIVASRAAEPLATANFCCSSILAIVAASIHGLILAVEGLLFWFTMFSVVRADWILVLLLLKNIGLVGTEIACAVVSCSAGGAAYKWRVQQQQGAGMQMAQPPVAVAVPMAQCHMPVGVAVGVPVPG